MDERIARLAASGVRLIVDDLRLTRTRLAPAAADASESSDTSLLRDARLGQYWAVSGRREASRRPGRAVVEGAAAAAVACIVAAIPVLTALKLREDGMALILAAAAAAGLLLQRIVALRNRREARVARDALLDDALAWWPAPLVQEADPYELGAFPPGTGDYSSRDVDAQLDAALQKPGYVLVIGPVGSGKSRAAFAALQRRLGEARLHVPEDAESLGQLIAAGPPLAAGPQGAVLWLDCVDRFLGGLRLDAVDRWIREGDIRSVVATIADEQVGELLQAPGPQGHVARRLLARARAIRVDAALTPAELVATRKQFPDRSFEHGVGHAFRPGWQPGPEPAFTAPMPDAKRRRRRLPDLGVALAVLAMLAITATVSGLALRYDGLKQPAALATQITQLKSDLRGCAKVVGSENAVHEGIPVVAIIEPDPKCAARRPESQSVVLYDDRYDVLEQVGGFAPPRSGPLMHSGFGVSVRARAPAGPIWSATTALPSSASSRARRRSSCSRWSPAARPSPTADRAPTSRAARPRVPLRGGGLSPSCGAVGVPHEPGDLCHVRR